MLPSPRLISPPSQGDRSTWLGEGDAWKLVLWLTERAGAPPLPTGRGLHVDPKDGVLEVNANEATIVFEGSHRGFHLTRPATDDATRLLELFVPLCVGPHAANRVFAHIAQSLDGRIATTDGESQYISGQEDLVHTHRLRAIADAVLIGVKTAACDDPLLTTRLVEGSHSTRVIIDPRGVLPRDARLLRDPSAPTLLVTDHESPPNADHIAVLRVPRRRGDLDLRQLLIELRARGLNRIFVEGGGVTVSRFVEASLLHRLHIAIAPTILGSGRSSFELPPLRRLSDRRHLDWRHYQLGRDILLDCELVADLPCP